MKLKGRRIYLAALEKADCRKLYEEQEYNFDNPMTDISFGYSIEKSDDWYEDIQKRLAAGTHVRVGVFLNDGGVIGDIALQDIDWQSRSASLGMNIPKEENKSQGYGQEALGLILKYAFEILGLERVWARTYATNPLGQKSLEKAGFVLEGVKRKAVYHFGKRIDEYHYAMLVEEYIANDFRNSD